MQTYNYGVDSYDLGEGFGHFGIGEALPPQMAALNGWRAPAWEVLSLLSDT